MNIQQIIYELLPIIQNNLTNREQELYYDYMITVYTIINESSKNIFTTHLNQMVQQIKGLMVDSEIPLPIDEIIQNINYDYVFIKLQELSRVILHHLEPYDNQELNIDKTKIALYLNKLVHYFEYIHTMCIDYYINMIILDLYEQILPHITGLSLTSEVQKVINILTNNKII
jgi:hypothetical protein